MMSANYFETEKEKNDNYDMTNKMKHQKNLKEKMFTAIYLYIHAYLLIIKLLLHRNKRENLFHIFHDLNNACDFNGAISFDLTPYESPSNNFTVQ